MSQPIYPQTVEIPICSFWGLLNRQIPGTHRGVRTLGLRWVLWSCISASFPGWFLCWRSLDHTFENSRWAQPKSSPSGLYGHLLPPFDNVTRSDPDDFCQTSFPLFWLYLPQTHTHTRMHTNVHTPLELKLTTGLPIRVRPRSSRGWAHKPLCTNQSQVSSDKSHHTDSICTDNMQILILSGLSFVRIAA